jgi:hypothetical protein
LTLAAGPRLTTCDCGADVLVVRVHRRVYGGSGSRGEKVEVYVERLAILPEHPCPDCVSRQVRGYGPQTFKRCQRCNGTRRIGQRRPTTAIAVDENGCARWLKGAERYGEGIYSLHADSCPLEALAV